MESLPPVVVYTVLRLAQPSGLPIARLACVSTGFARMAKEHLWRWHCRDQLALDASPSDARRSDSEARANSARANAVKDALAAITANREDPISRRERLERMLHDMGSEEVFTLAKLVNVCPGVRPALLRGREYKAMNCGCGSSLQCACWQPFASVEGHPSSAPHFHPSKFEIMDIFRSGVPEVHFVMFACLVHEHEEHDAVPFFLIRGLVMDFQSFKMYESQTPFICDEQCPYCSSQVWDMMQLLNFPRVSKILICYAGSKIYVTFPEVVTYVCTKGHLYGLRRLGEAMRAVMAEVEVERVEGHEGSQSSQGSEDHEEAEREASDEAYYAVLGRFLQRAVRGELEEEETDDDVSNEEEETDDDVSNEEEETDDDVSNEEGETDDDVSNEEEETDDDVSNEEEETDDDVSNEEGETDDDVSNEEEETDDDVKPGTPTSGAQAAALTVPAAAGPAATPELAHAHVVKAAASAAAAAHAPNAAPVDITMPSATTSGAASAAASDSASLLPTAAAIPHGQLFEAPQP
ncbi:unnamed protein product, partial [Closterium sp. Naga37s-1]